MNEQVAHETIRRGEAYYHVHHQTSHGILLIPYDKALPIALPLEF